MRKSILYLVALIAASCNSKTGVVIPDYLRAEYKENCFTDVKSPRFSWIALSDENDQKQRAYQLLVASSKEMLTDKSADLWNSGKVKSSENAQIEYGGEALKSRQECWYKVRLWDKGNNASLWSEPAKLEMAFLDSNEWKAQWISYDLTTLGKGERYHLPPVPAFRKEFNLKGEVKKARLYATAKGVYEININGEKAGS